MIHKMQKGYNTRIILSSEKEAFGVGLRFIQARSERACEKFIQDISKGLKIGKKKGIFWTELKFGLTDESVISLFTLLYEHIANNQEKYNVILGDKK